MRFTRKMTFIFFLTILTDLILNNMAECPNLCQCKWKNGKETVICLSANLSSVPSHLDSGTQVLDLSSNKIGSLKEDEFNKAGLFNLQRLYLSRCRIKTLNKFAFRNLKNLVEMDLSYNYLSSIPTNSFELIPELRELKLNGNPILKIRNSAFQSLSQLVRLEMSECRISSIEIRAFEGLEKSLEWLKLDKNRLVDVNSESVDILEHLHGLDIAGNPWNCSCSLRPLREWMVENNIPYGAPPSCYNPKRLKGKTWDKLDIDEFACVPEISALEEVVRGSEGKNVTMACRATGIPFPKLRWFLKNRIITNVSSATSHSDIRKFHNVHLDNNGSLLTILSADVQDAGRYICSAENSAGRAQASVLLAISRRPLENGIFSQTLFLSVTSGVFLALGLCSVVVCLCTLRKNHRFIWKRHKKDEIYEKIELNGDISIVGMVKTNGDYSFVPAGDSDEEEEKYETSRGFLKKTPTSMSGLFELLPGRLSWQPIGFVQPDLLETSMDRS